MEQNANRERWPRVVGSQTSRTQRETRDSKNHVKMRETEEKKTKKPLCERIFEDRNIQKNKSAIVVGPFCGSACGARQQHQF